MGRVCRGYRQDLVVVHHNPALCPPHSGKKKAPRPPSSERADSQNQSRSASISDRNWPYARCVDILVQHYIPKDEIPFLLHVEPSKSRICGGWVQALPHVSQDHEDFENIVSPAVRALTMSMMVNGTDMREEYLNTYGAALEGIRFVLDRPTESVGPNVAIASMCLALSEVRRSFAMSRV